MNRAITFIAVFLLAFAVILGAIWFIGGRKSADSTGQNSGISQKSSNIDLTKTSGDTNPGNVSVDVTLVTEDNASQVGAEGFNLDKQYVFYVEMNTHSVDISGFKMENISSLVVDGKKAKVLKWESAMEGAGHHRNGFLVFQKPAGNVKKLVLVIKGIPNIAERDFQWKL